MQRVSIGLVALALLTCQLLCLQQVRTVGVQLGTVQAELAQTRAQLRATLDAAQRPVDGAPYEKLLTAVQASCRASGGQQIGASQERSADEPLEDDGEGTQAAPGAPLPHTQSYEGARRLLASALSHGHWGEEDADAMRSYQIGLSGAERDEIMLGLVVAINEGRVQVTTDGPVL